MSTATVTETYSVTDIEVVMRRVTSDLIMIAASTSAITEEKAKQYAHDIELLARCGYLKSADITLLSGAVEVRAARFEVNTAAGDLSMQRPGGALWPKVDNASIRIIVTYTDAYTDIARDSLKQYLKIGWVPSSADTSHSGLTASDGREYESNGYGVKRKDLR